MTGASLGSNSATKPYSFRVALGELNGVSNDTKFGYNPTVGTTEAEIWNQGGIEAYLTSAETMNIASTDANDDGDPASTGARTLQIFGLDDSYLEINETITLNGTTNVTTSNSYLRVFRMVVLTAGSSGHNEGTITATASTSSSVHAKIEPTFNQTTKIQFTVPAGKQFLITNAIVGVDEGKSVQIKFKIRPFGQVFQTKRIQELFEQTVVFDDFIPILVPEKSDITLTGIAGAGTDKITAQIDYYIYG